MKEIHYATTNEKKVSSLKKVLSQYGISVIHDFIELPESRSNNLHKIAKQKVLAAFKEVGKPVVALDCGFYIFSLGGFPETFVKTNLRTIRIKGFLKLTEDEGKECEFRDCLAYYDGKMDEPLFFESSVKGRVATEPRGRMKKRAWSKLFLIFIPEGEVKTLAEMTAKEYQVWSRKHHKDSYASKFAKWFTGQ